MTYPTRGDEKVISQFTGPHRFLSNFYPAKVVLDDVEYPTVEHAYQAAKTTDLKLRRRIREAPTPGKAKKLGNTIKMQMSVPAWNAVRTAIMYGLLMQKFSDPELRKMLDETGNAELVEGNNHGDVFWGVCRGKGENRLGMLLVLIRDGGKP